MQMVRTSLLYCSYVFLVSPFIAFAQTTYLDLKPIPLNLGDTPFYLTRVVDARQNTNCIGEVTRQENGQAVCLKFSKGLETTFYNQIAPSLPKNDSGKLEMVIKVVELVVQEQLIKDKKKWITGLQMEIYHIKNGLETNLFRSSSKTEITGFKQEINFAEEIQFVIKDCLSKFIRDKAVRDYANQIFPEKPNPNRYHTRLLVNQSVGLNAKTLSFIINLYRITDTGKWVIPLSTSFDLFKIHGKGYRFYVDEGSTISFAAPGISAYRKLSTHWWINFKGQVPVGIEKEVTLTDSRHHFVFGFGLSQSIIMIPPEKAGFTFGLGSYQRILKSEVYPWDLGLVFELGLKF